MLVCSLSLFLQLLLLKSTDGSDVDWSKEVKGNMYDMIVEGFQLLSRWTARIWEQCAWKFSRPCKDVTPLESHDPLASFSDYEKVRYNLVFYLLMPSSSFYPCVLYSCWFLLTHIFLPICYETESEFFYFMLRKIDRI